MEEYALRSCVCIDQKSIKAEMLRALIKGSKEARYAVKLFSKETCQCSSTVSVMIL